MSSDHVGRSYFEVVNGIPDTSYSPSMLPRLHAGNLKRGTISRGLSWSHLNQSMRSRAGLPRYGGV